MPWSNWSRKDKIRTTSLAVAIIAATAAVFVVPEFREFVGFDALLFKEVAEERTKRKLAEQKLRDAQAELIERLQNAIGVIDIAPSTFSRMMDKIIKELETAIIAFNAPDTMEVGETRQVVLLMSRGLSVKSLIAMLPTNFSDTSRIGVIYTDSVKTSAIMEAYLNGERFTIKPVSNVQQFVRKDGDTRWEWTITADEKGERILYLTLNVLIDYNGKKFTQTMETYRKTIYVYVNPSVAVWTWIEKNANWIVALFGVIISAILSHYLTLLQERKKLQETKRLEREKKSKLILP